jgi:hypothetical protein
LHKTKVNILKNYVWVKENDKEGVLKSFDIWSSHECEDGSAGSSGLWRHIELYVDTNVSEKYIFSIFRDKGGDSKVPDADTELKGLNQNFLQLALFTHKSG